MPAAHFTIASSVAAASLAATTECYTDIADERRSRAVTVTSRPVLDIDPTAVIAAPDGLSALMKGGGPCPEKARVAISGMPTAHFTVARACLCDYCGQTMNDMYCGQAMNDASPCDARRERRYMVDFNESEGESAFLVVRSTKGVWFDNPHVFHRSLAKVPISFCFAEGAQVQTELGPTASVKVGGYFASSAEYEEWYQRRRASLTLPPSLGAEAGGVINDVLLKGGGPSPGRPASEEAAERFRQIEQSVRAQLWKNMSYRSCLPAKADTDLDEMLTL
ncbi:hypothetical protein EMIHUDRAFT_214720 [Emiliania huxleyi CCMP1516]|uniref:Uncharacterized protein n=2 Tax=Emiliania huxleyi TaxID=2903 RepID=A0A0D3IJE0_EMIH1|nr:hypothetical protein EMIHUDRAFT_214720 [Emiliania huxleyi CCMP1516]EOD11375.1 hypothetical protein EMIHUDRAFT_214720 [Emiliania huxleyi CCMP1516]|eukprot:XP_005763804.1 hypothetical protein EMIHUDRAFT_214720 [Emiliania huxleyi CCMP1516]